jgi:hypothetical protein
MGDYRLKWIKGCVYTALELSDDTLFENLLARDEQKVEKELVALLDQASDDYSPAVIFYCMQHEVEEMVEVVEGMYMYVCMCLCMYVCVYVCMHVL